MGKASTLSLMVNSWTVCGKMMNLYLMFRFNMNQKILPLTRSTFIFRIKPIHTSTTTKSTFMQNNTLKIIHTITRSTRIIMIL